MQPTCLREAGPPPTRGFGGGRRTGAKRPREGRGWCGGDGGSSAEVYGSTRTKCLICLICWVVTVSIATIAAAWQLCGMSQSTTYRPCLPRCPWCRRPAQVWRERPGGGIRTGRIAGCSNPARGAGPPTDCVIYPHTLPMTTRAAAIREWKKLLLPPVRLQDHAFA
jgi:hypothetical protein